MNVFYLISAFYFGACIGSFLNVVIWRLPQNLPLNGRSFCPNCHHQLAWYDLLPIFGTIWRRFKCGYCQNNISPRYLIIELVTASLFALSFWFLQPQTLPDYYSLLIYWFIIAIGIVVFVIDLEHYLILDKIVWPSVLVMGALLVGADLITKSSGQLVISSLLGVVAVAGFFYLIWLISKGKWIGFGDVKFAIFMGLALGFIGSLVALFIAFMLGSIVGVALMLFGNKNMQSKMPFGTFLTAGMIIALFFGGKVAHFYLTLIGWY